MKWVSIWKWIHKLFVKVKNINVNSSVLTIIKKRNNIIWLCKIMKMQNEYSITCDVEVNHIDDVVLSIDSSYCISTHIGMNGCACMWVYHRIFTLHTYSLWLCIKLYTLPIHKYIFWNYILPLKTLKNQYKSKYYLFNFNICKNTGQKYVNKRLHLFNGIFNFCFWIIWFSFSMKKYFNIGRSNNVTDLIDFMKNNFDWFVSYDHIVLNFIPNLTFSDRIEFTLNFQNFIPTKSSIMSLLPLVFFLYPIHVYIMKWWNLMINHNQLRL